MAESSQSFSSRGGRAERYGPMLDFENDDGVQYQQQRERNHNQKSEKWYDIAPVRGDGPESSLPVHITLEVATFGLQESPNDEVRGVKDHGEDPRSGCECPAQPVAKKWRTDRKHDSTEPVDSDQNQTLDRNGSGDVLEEVNKFTECQADGSFNQPDLVSQYLLCDDPRQNEDGKYEIRTGHVDNEVVYSSTHFLAPVDHRNDEGISHNGKHKNCARSKDLSGLFSC